MGPRRVQTFPNVFDRLVDAGYLAQLGYCLPKRDAQVDKIIGSPHID